MRLDSAGNESRGSNIDVLNCVYVVEHVYMRKRLV